MTEQEKRHEYHRRKHEEALPAYEALMSCYPFGLEDLPGEIWRDIEGYSGDYQVSTYGRVKSFKQGKTMIRKPVLSSVYLSVDLFIDGEPKRRTIHSLVAETFIPNPLNKPEVNHKIGCKFNCCADNLEWSTRAENNQHAVRTGLQKSGIDSHDAKIQSEADIIYIRDNPDNLTQEQLAEMFGVHSTAIGQIQLGKSYANEGGTIRKARKIKRSPNLTEETKQKILADWATGQYSKSALGRKYGYCPSTIGNIINK